MYSSVVQLADFPSWLWVLNLKVNIVFGVIVLAVTERHNSINNCPRVQEAAFVTADEAQISIEDLLLILLVSVCTPNPPAPVGSTLAQKRDGLLIFHALLIEKIGKVCKNCSLKEAEEPGCVVNVRIIMQPWLTGCVPSSVFQTWMEMLTFSCVLRTIAIAKASSESSQC